MVTNGFYFSRGGRAGGLNPPKRKSRGAQTPSHPPLFGAENIASAA